MLVENKNGLLIINMDNEINPWYGISFTEIRDAVAEFEGLFVSVKVFINSPGGSVTEGMAIRNYILSLVEQGYEVDIEVMGVAASIASVIALAGTSLKMRTGAYIMIHRPYTIAVIDYEEAQNLAKTLKAMFDDFISIYMEKATVEQSEMEAMVNAETWITAKEAIKLGFSSKVTISARDEIMNSLVVTPQDASIWESFKNIPENLHTNLDAVQDNNPNSNEEIFMNLKDATTAHPSIQNEVDTQVKAAVNASNTITAKNEADRITGLINLAGGQMTAEVQAAIDNGSSKADLALTMVENGTAPVAQQQPVATPATPTTPTVPVNNTNVIPPIDPQVALLTEEAAAVAKADKDFDNMMSGIFPKEGE